MLGLKFVHINMRQLLVVSFILLIMTLASKAEDLCEDRNYGWAFQNNPNSISTCAAKFLVKKPKKVRIAIIDTGADLKHPMISKLLKSDLSEDQKRSINSLAFKNAEDSHGHGTHLAGIIASIGDQVFEKNNPIEIIPIKMQDGQNWSPEENAIAIKLAIANGAKIINLSSGGSGSNLIERSALIEANEAGVLVVTAAGNDSSQIGARRSDGSYVEYYPAEYNLPNMITVGAIDSEGAFDRASNWGDSVDVAAPGRYIVSAFPGGGYALMSGTSQATAFVSGVAAVLLSQDPKLSPQDLKTIIESSVKPNPKLITKIKTGGQVDLNNALLKLQGHRKLPALKIK